MFKAYRDLYANHGDHMKKNRWMVAAAESFDGTWVMAILAASVTERPVEVLIGALIGLSFVQWFAVELGNRLRGRIPSAETVQRVMGVVFILLSCLFFARAFELIEFNPAALLQKAASLNFFIFVPIIALTIGVFEIFDKTAAVTMYSSATSGLRMATFVSSMEGLIIANSLGVLGLGYLISLFMTPQNIELVSGIIFVTIGTYLVIGGKDTIKGWFGM